MDANQIEAILAETRANLKRGRSSATGIGMFLVVVDVMGNPLLRRRQERDSLYGEDLSGKWELPGGGMELNHFVDAGSEEPNTSRYQLPIFRVLQQELREETGLTLIYPFKLVMVPAFLCREHEREGEKRVTIDLAFSVRIPFPMCMQTQAFWELMRRNELMFVPRERLSEVEMVSPRMRFLLEEGLKAVR